MPDNKHDVIFIGSGIGTLTTAAILAKMANKKALILEKHWTVGGLTHEFERKHQFSWDVGIHYVGQAVGSTFPAKVFQYISDGNMEWEKITDPYDTFVYPDCRFEVPSDRQAYIKKVVDLFPEEKQAIVTYFRDAKRVAMWATFQFFQRFVPNSVASVFRLLSRRNNKKAALTTQEYLDANFKSEKLKALLVSQWGDYGVSPNTSAFWIHATIVEHYMGGAYYPKGGSRTLADTILPVIEKAGGTHILNCEVTEILVENNTAVGCKCSVQRGGKVREETFYAPIIISDAGVHTTFRKLLKEPLFPELDALQTGDSMITVYIGLRDSPASLGLKGGNFWIFDGYDHNEMVATKVRDILDIRFCFASFPSLKNSLHKGHTAELITVMHYDFFKKWADLPWQERGADYEELKQKIAEKLLDIVEKTIPGFRNLVEYIEVSTPLTMKKFTGREMGMMYGTPITSDRNALGCFQPITPIKNLYITGGDVFALGIAGATMGGVAAACAVMGKWSFLKVMPKIVMAKFKKKVAVVPAAAANNTAK